MDMNDRWIGEVIDVFDPEESSRLKIRIFGLHDDTTKIPDEHLPWARCVFPVTNPVHQGVSGATTGLIRGTRVVGYFADKAKQIPLITGTLGGVANSSYDFPKADRGEDFNEVLDKSLTEVGLPGLKYLVEQTIGSIQYLGQDINQLMNQIGSGNILGAISTAQQTISDFNNLKNTVVNGSMNDVSGLVSSFVGAAIPPQVSNTITTAAGTVVSIVDGSITPEVQSQITDTINQFAGNIATRTSKLPMTNTSDVVNRLNGSRFVMGYVMPSLDSALNKMMSENNG